MPWVAHFPDSAPTWLESQLPCDFNVLIVLSSVDHCCRNIVSYCVTRNSMSATWSVMNLMRDLKSFSDDVMYPVMRSVARPDRGLDALRDTRRVREVAEVAGRVRRDA